MSNSIELALQHALLEVLRSPEGQAAIRRAVASERRDVAPVTSLRSAEYLSVAECATISGKTPDTIRRHIDAGDLPASKPAGSREWSVRRLDLERWMEGSTKDPSETELDELARRKAGLR
jgi:excisionase family DNA binding protein